MPTPKRSIRPVGNRQIHVIDGAVEEATIDMIAEWLGRLPYTRDGIDNSDDAISVGFRHLTHRIPLETLRSQPLYRALLKAVDSEIESAYGDLGPDLVRAYVNLTTFGEHFTPHIDDHCGVTAIYYANREWPDMWHGETYFYDRGEAVSTVAPRPGRIALMPADIVHRVGDCSRLCQEGRYTVALKYRTVRKAA